MEKRGGNEQMKVVHDGSLSTMTRHSPEKVLLGRGTEVILDVKDGERMPGLLSKEGRSGFLLSTDNFQAQFLEMAPGLYSEEHVHDYGFMIFTAEGRWVLCSEGHRCMMGPGSICSLQPGASMGMESPFEQPARLIFLLEGGNAVRAKYEEYLKRMGCGPIAERTFDVPRISDLPRSHPARIFAERAIIDRM